jgi:hypothetical protein
MGARIGFARYQSLVGLRLLSARTASRAGESAGDLGWRLAFTGMRLESFYADLLRGKNLSAIGCSTAHLSIVTAEGVMHCDTAVGW